MNKKRVWKGDPLSTVIACAVALALYGHMHRGYFRG